MKLRLFLIFIFSLLFYLVCNSYIAITDPVESNYALTAKEMLLSGDWLSPQIYGHYWFDKPIMIYWLIAASFKLFGISEFAARFPSAVFGGLSVSFAYWFSYTLFHHKRIALLSALILATSLEFWILSRMVITDSVLFFFTSVALAFMYLGILKKNSRFCVVAYCAAALAVLTKGPVGIILPGIILLLFILLTQSWRGIRYVFSPSGVAAFLLVCIPWYWAMYQIHGSDFINTFLGLHNYVRATVSEHPQDNVFYYYLVLFPLSLLPWTGIWLYSLFKIPGWLKDKKLIFLLTWTYTIIIFYHLMATKYPTYVFPAMFPVALLMGYLLDEILKKNCRKTGLWVTIPTLFFFLLFSAGTSFLNFEGNWNTLYISAALCFLAILWLHIKGPLSILPYGIALTVCLISTILLSQVVIPLAENRSANKISAYIPKTEVKVGSYGEYSTSAVFYSDYIIPSLVTEKADPNTDLWSGKYTMPEETISNFLLAQNRVTFILVKDKNKDAFQQESFSKDFFPVHYENNITLYQRKPL